MKLLILLLFCILLPYESFAKSRCGPFRRMFPDHGNLDVSPLENSGDALFLTPLLKAGKIKVDLFIHLFIYLYRC